MAEKKPRLNTPIGEARWAHLQSPHAFKDKNSGREKGSPKYSIDVAFEPEDAKWKAWAGRIMQIVRALPEKKNDMDQVLPKMSPIKAETDQEGNKTGRFIASFKTGEQFKPPTFDRFGQLVESEIGNGSRVVVNYSENVFEAFGQNGGGMNLYLNAVQVVELVPFGMQTASAFGFDVQPMEEMQTDNRATGEVISQTKAIDDLPF